MSYMRMAVCRDSRFVIDPFGREAYVWGCITSLTDATYSARPALSPYAAGLVVLLDLSLLDRALQAILGCDAAFGDGQPCRR